MEIHSRNKEKSKWDSVAAGLLVAIAVPCVVFIFYWYLTLYPQCSLGEMFTTLPSDTLMKVFTLCASPNLLVVLLFTRRNWNDGAKGMILAILLMLVATVITKL